MNMQLKRRLLVLAFLLSTSATAAFAQDTTETPAAPEEGTATVVPPPAFTDGRISDIVGLGGLALYCVDENNVNVSSLDDGSITVWGVGDQKYIELSAEELRGDMEVSQEPSVAEVEGELTEAAPVAEATDVMEETSDILMAEATEVVPDMTPVLLARASTPNGEIGFFRIGNDDTFALQGNDDKGAFFTYTWTGCNTGTVNTVTGPFASFLNVPMMSSTMEATEEMTSSDMNTDMTPEATEASS